MEQEKLGLVLDGGGARGAYQIGALKALEEKGYRFDGVVGTSIGALNGALFCQDELALAQEIWENLDYKHVFAYEDELYHNYEAFMRLDMKSVDFSTLVNGALKIIRDGGLDNEPMQQLIHENLKESVIRDSGMDYGLVTVNITDKKAESIFIEDIPVGKLADYILASAYVPIFKKATFNGKNFIDGGFYDNSPVNMLLDRGYKKLIVIKLGGRLAIQRDYEAADARVFIIEPKEDLGDLLEFDLKRIRYNIHLGYYDATRSVEGLSGTRYYLENFPASDEFVRKLSKVRETDILVLKSIWRSDVEDCQRYMYEVVTKKAVQVLKLPSKWTYEELFVGIVEYFMRCVKSPRFRIHDWKTLSLELPLSIKAYKKEQSYEIALEVLLKVLLRN